MARLIGAAELQVATHASGLLTAQDIMSRDVVTVAPEAPLNEIANLFRRHRFTALPVAGADQAFHGVIFQIHLISQARDDALRLDRGFRAAFRRLLDRDNPITAAEVMSVAGPRATTNTPISALLPMMAEGDTDAVPVLEYSKIVGIVTRTDLIAALARSVARAG